MLIKKKHFLWIWALVLLFVLPAHAQTIEDAWMDREVITLGESVTVYWVIDPASEDQSIGLYSDGREDNGRPFSEEVIIDTQPAGQHTFTPTLGGRYHIRGWVGDTGPVYLPLQVEGAPDEGYFSSMLTLDKASAQVGETITATATLSQGRPPYDPTTYTWYVQDAAGNEQLVQQYATETPCTLAVPEGIQGWVKAETRDAAGRMAFSVAYFGIGSGEPLSVQLSVDKYLVQEQQPITATWSISGGDAPYTYEPMWNLVASSDGLYMYGDVEYGDMQSTFKPEETGYGSVYVNVTDARGRQITSPTIEFLSVNEQGQLYLPVLTPGVLTPPHWVNQGHTPQANGQPHLLEAYGKQPIQLNLTLNTTTPQPGEIVHADWSITGGQPPYQCLLYWNQEGEGTIAEAFTSGTTGSAELAVQPGMGTITFELLIIDGQDGEDYFRTTSAEWGLDITVGAAPAPAALLPATLNQRMATRSGPGTKYTEELGTLPKDTPIVLVETVTTRGTPWGLVEFTIRGLPYRAYTGMKRIDTQGPVPEGSEEYTTISLPAASPAYYGPGYQYAQRKNSVPAGTTLNILRTENGFWQCDYQQGGSWVRAYIPVQ